MVVDFLKGLELATKCHTREIHANLNARGSYDRRSLSTALWDLSSPRPLCILGVLHNIEERCRLIYANTHLWFCCRQPQRCERFESAVVEQVACSTETRRPFFSRAALTFPLPEESLIRLTTSRHTPRPSVSLGPPTERHSVAAVIVGRGINDELSPAEVSGFARVQQAVGKRSVIATAPLATEDTASASASTSTGTGTEVGATLAATRTDHARIPGVSSQEPAGGRPQSESVSRAAATTNESVRYVTLRFHSVSSRG